MASSGPLFYVNGPKSIATGGSPCASQLITYNIKAGNNYIAVCELIRNIMQYMDDIGWNAWPLLD